VNNVEYKVMNEYRVARFMDDGVYTCTCAHVPYKRRQQMGRWGPNLTHGFIFTHRMF